MAVCTLAAQRTRLIELNRLEYGEVYAGLSFLPAGTESLVTAKRNQLLEALRKQCELGCGGTKLDMRHLSPGCQVCVEGSWSCLFINGRCNAHCFYCPSRQDETSLPTTNAVAFRSPADYVAYLERFGFRGMSLSGGEPLLTPGRSLAFLAAAKRRFGDRLHAWLYTNGTLVDRDILLRLRDAGLDEIRFDIGAVGYSLQKAQLAVGIVPTVTVEIPAVPEDQLRLQEKMGEMAECGINHLNLHQLRLTPYSHHRFAGRPYTYLHGEKVTVLESELTALELIRYAHVTGLELPVNYCSFVYKNRYQKAAARRRSAAEMCKPYEEVTSAGFVRSLALTGPSDLLADQAERFGCAACDGGLWSLQPNRQRLGFAPELWNLIDFAGFDLVVSYAECAIREQVSYRNPFQEIRLPSGRKVVVERTAAAEFVLSGADIEGFVRRYLNHGNDHALPVDSSYSAIHPYECIMEGLQDYF